MKGFHASRLRPVMVKMTRRAVVSKSDAPSSRNLVTPRGHKIGLQNQTEEDLSVSGETQINVYQFITFISERISKRSLTALTNMKI